MNMQENALTTMHEKILSRTGDPNKVSSTISNVKYHGSAEQPHERSSLVAREEPMTFDDHMNISLPGAGSAESRRRRGAPDDEDARLNGMMSQASFAPASRVGVGRSDPSIVIRARSPKKRPDEGVRAELSRLGDEVDPLCDDGGKSLPKPDMTGTGTASRRSNEYVFQGMGRPTSSGRLAGHEDVAQPSRWKPHR